MTIRMFHLTILKQLKNRQMKKILIIISILMLCTNSCKESIWLDNVQKAPFVYFETAPPATIGVNNMSDINFTGKLLNSGGVVSYELSIFANLSGELTDTFAVATYTTFPVDLDITGQQIADILGIDLNDLNFGDIISFAGRVKDKDGIVYYDLLPDIDEEFDENGELINYTYSPNGNLDFRVYDLTNGYKTGFNFNFMIACPANSFDANSLVGTWQWTVDEWETYADDGIFEVVAGPGANQITCVDVFDHPVPGNPNATYNLIIDVNPATNNITVAPQSTWHPATWGFAAWGQGYHRGTGLMFGCVGQMMLDLEVYCATRGWGVWPYTAVKIIPKK